MDLQRLVRGRRQVFNYSRSKDALISSLGRASFPKDEIIMMPFNSNFREKLGSGALDNYINNAIENSGQAGALNKMLGRNNKDFHEAKIISMGKFKEDKANRELMDKNNG